MGTFWRFHLAFLQALLSGSSGNASAWWAAHRLSRRYLHTQAVGWFRCSTATVGEVDDKGVLYDKLPRARIRLPL